MTIEQFFSNYDPKVQDICIYLRKVVKECLPEAQEILFEGWKNISYGNGKSKSDKDLIVYIAPFKDSVNLGFFNGVNLTDSKKLLKGTGALLRHIKFKAVSDYSEEDIKELIIQAGKIRESN